MVGSSGTDSLESAVSVFRTSDEASTAASVVESGALFASS